MKFCKKKIPTVMLLTMRQNRISWVLGFSAFKMSFQLQPQ